jgi:ATP-dependent protease ClpP protease subunit
MGRSTQNNTIAQNSKSPMDSSEDILMQSLVVQQAEHVRIVVLHGDVNEHTISHVIVQLLQLANQNQALYLQ